MTPTVSGVTDANGEFEYRAGEAVLFSIGKLTLPVVVASGRVTPLDMGASQNVTDNDVVNIARLLQSLDEDSNPANGISISKQVAAAFNQTEVFNADDDAALTAAVDKAFNGEREAVTALAAESHLIETLSAGANSVATLGQLQYLVPLNEAFVGDSLFIDGNNYELTDNGGETESGIAIVQSGVYQLLGEQDSWFVSVMDTDEAKFACIAKSPKPVADCSGNVYQVFDEEQQALAFAGSGNNSGSDAFDIGAAMESIEEETTEELFPVCQPGTEDPESDGYGWQNDQSCVIPAVGAPQQNAGAEVVVEEPVANESEQALVPAAPTDVVQGEVPATPAPTSEQLIVVDVTPVTEENVPESEQLPEPESEPAPVEAPITEISTDVSDSIDETVTPAPVVVPPAPAAITPSDITDLIVLTGQTNAAARETAFDAVLDANNERIFAFVDDGSWLEADLHQNWDENLPGNFSLGDPDRQPYNNLAFQLAKVLVEQPDRVVGIIMVTAPGEGISHWDYESDFYRKIRNRVTAALAVLPQKDTIDAMIWAQGETDWLFEGSADAGATGFSSTDTEFYREYYPNKLSQLISNLRSEFWFASQAQFICAETKKAELNPHLMALNADSDELTGCAQASDLATRPGDPFNNQFSAASLRTLASRLADIYLGQ